MSLQMNTRNAGCKNSFDKQHPPLDVLHKPAGGSRYRYRQMILRKVEHMAGGYLFLA